MLEKIEWSCEACQRAVLLVRKERGEAMRRNEAKGGHFKAVVLGALGFLALVFGSGLIARATGASVRADPRGLIVIVIIGAALGIIGNELFKRGYRRGYANAEEDELKTTDRRLRRAEGEDGADGG